jgi:eukaryotic-like serine/threonine-protein kinase
MPVLDGRYRLGAVLGRGGMADVYRARDEHLDRAVAIKMFRRESSAPEQVRRQRTEVQILAGLRHPGLVAVYDTGTDDSCPGDPRSYLVLELVEGQTLGEHLAGGPIPGPEVAVIGRQLAAALAYVHSRGVVHRDVKPANILLDRAGDGQYPVAAKLADFGVARFLDSTRVTTYGTTVGTANYLSPEQALGQEVTPACDVYSLGLVLLECLTGTRCYPGYGVEAALARLNRDPCVPASLGARWQALLTAMTARRPDRRPGAAEVARRLHLLTLGGQGAVSGVGLDAGETTGELRAPAAGARREHVRGRLVGVAVAALLVTVLVTAGFGGPSGSAPAPTSPTRTAAPVDAGAQPPAVVPSGDVARTSSRVAPPPAVRVVTSPRPAPSLAAIKITKRLSGRHSSPRRHHRRGRD